jgi:hypothetical protein
MKTLITFTAGFITATVLPFVLPSFVSSAQYTSQNVCEGAHLPLCQKGYDECREMLKINFNPNLDYFNKNTVCYTK